MDVFLKLAHEFTEEDRIKCEKTVQRVLDLGEIARREGLLALESAIDEHDDFFLRLAAYLIVDGTDPVIVEEILNNLILSGDYSSYEKLNACIIVNGFLSMQAGENPRLIQIKLLSMLGENIFMKLLGNELLDKTLQNAIEQERHQIALAKLEANKQEAFNESRQFEAIFLDMNDKSIQCLLRNIINTDLIIALSGCSAKGIRRVLDNLSIRLAEMILDEIIRCNASKQNILNAQDRILKQMGELEKRGEIIVKHFV